MHKIAVIGGDGVHVNHRLGGEGPGQLPLNGPPPGPGRKQVYAPQKRQNQQQIEIFGSCESEHDNLCF